MPRVPCLRLAASLFFFAVSSAQADLPDRQISLRLGTNEVSQGHRVGVPLLLDSNCDLEGITAVFEWDGEHLQGFDLSPAVALNNAAAIDYRVESDFMVISIEFESDGGRRVALPAGNGILLATASFYCVPGSYGTVGAPLHFRDGAHPVTAGEPPLDNTVLAEGVEITAEGGLRLSDGLVTCNSTREAGLRIDNASAVTNSRCVEVDILLDNPNLPVEGFVLAITHPPLLDLVAISTSQTVTERMGAEFIQDEIFPGGGTLSVVIDLLAPFEENAIPPGDNQVIARFAYCCTTPARIPLQAVDEALPLRFADGVLGNPPKENTVIAGGKPRPLLLRNGSVVCRFGPELCDDLIDNDGNGMTDCEDPVCLDDPHCRPGPHVFALGGGRRLADGSPAPLEIIAGEPLETGLYYKSPPGDAQGLGISPQIQGLSIVLCHPCELRCRKGPLDISGTILEAVGAEFVDLQCDSDSEDGDGCEVIIAIMVDAMPPFDGTALPATDDFLRLGTLTFDTVEAPDLCANNLTLEFCESANGRGRVPVNNLVSVNNRSFSPRFVDHRLTVRPSPLFYRGDCDFSGRINISDAVVTVLSIFSSSESYVPPCRDACDCNDDGQMGFADAVCLLRFLFRSGSRPPAPGPGFDPAGAPLPPGPDPTEDQLDCLSGITCEE